MIGQGTSESEAADVAVTEPNGQEAVEVAADEGPSVPGGDYGRVIIAVVLLALVLAALGFILIDYRARVLKSQAAAAAKASAVRVIPKPIAPAKPATATTAPKAPAAGGTIVVLVDGVNFREHPNGSARIISTLPKGTKLTYVAQQGSWFNATAPDGAKGWLTASPQYVERQ